MRISASDSFHSSDQMQGDLIFPFNRNRAHVAFKAEVGQSLKLCERGTSTFPRDPNSRMTNLLSYASMAHGKLSCRFMHGD